MLIFMLLFFFMFIFIFISMFRECSEEDELVYDALLQQWFTLVNKKNTLIRLEFSLIIESEQNKKICMLEIFKKKTYETRFLTTK